MGIASNKRRGHQAEIEAQKIVEERFPEVYHMERTGLDTGHDLRGRHAIAEVKSVAAGPAWLKSMIEQLDSGPPEKAHIGMLRLNGSGGRPARWMIVLDMEQFIGFLNSHPGL